MGILDKGRREFSRIVAGAKPFELDHVGTQIAEHLGAGWPGQHAGQIYDGYARQRANGI